MNNSWLKWPVLEAGSKTINRLLSKIIGSSSKSFAGAFFVSFFVSLIQTVISFTIIQKRKINLQHDKKLYSIIFGVIAVSMTFLTVATFNYEGADIGITTFFVSLAVIPGAIIDRIFFSQKLSKRQMLGIFFYVLTAYSFLNFPPLQEILILPVWVWMSIALAIMMAINENLIKKLKDVNSYVHQFWSGGTGVLLSATLITFLGYWNISGSFSKTIWFAILAVGVNVVFMITFKLLSYRDGGYVALKSLVMQGSYLITANLVGMLFFHESLTVGKIIGMFGFTVSFIFTNIPTWEYIQNKIKK